MEAHPSDFERPPRPVPKDAGLSTIETHLCRECWRTKDCISPSPDIIFLWTINMDDQPGHHWPNVHGARSLAAPDKIRARAPMSDTTHRVMITRTQSVRNAKAMAMIIAVPQDNARQLTSTYASQIKKPWGTKSTCSSSCPSFDRELRRCHVVERRTRETCGSHIFKRPRLLRAICSSPTPERLGVFLLRGDGAGR